MARDQDVAIEDRLRHDFGYHPPSSPEVANQHGNVRTVLLSAAQQVVALTPQSREQSLALTKIEEAMMWANAAIARHQDR